MPKISPRVEVTSSAAYQAGMAAQHLAYQLMREVPADRKAEAARLHGACVHMTTYAAYAVDPDARNAAESWRFAADSAREARERLEPLAALAGDEKDVEVLRSHLDEIEKAAAAALGAAA